MNHVTRVTATATIGAKTEKLMQHMGKEIYNLKQQFYKIKQVKVPVIVQQNDWNKTLTI